ncbi:UDP-2,4-diacetamido-2,4,6-trideoxy-beta-L-altropyranose hydrolase [Alteromonas sp. ASW11-19]|uniref:UDP-2,4-diacetamido-2,4, 6-trideoxy-beta-L-altropyranose hydrolase n=1 Tax=Alteromonas salexigens TaxID=2982530 RepID=A0ABT2VNZ3_9ALTE|nr:UDP-2,4-diacetamido-2,4,6-trideoxy-beta-L-altropyranose hydrolase [Alteromonas salexigens]MCU7554989.1 UDP-2,4-diacetamido-2,4,6-trideoxy-beta-L-altropyranose hydrolase [Alteromonas salexigens]
MGAYSPVTRLVFWVEASQESGVGHLFRCMALAQAAEEQGLESVFVLTPEAAAIARAQHEWNFAVKTVNGSESADAVAALLSDYISAVLIVDGYSLPINEVNELSGHAAAMVVMDDGEQRLIANAAVIVNPATQALDENYRLAAPHAIVCSGEDYRLLRRDFQHWRPLPMDQRNGIVINFGGSDPSRMTAPLVAALESAGATMPIRVITGAANPHVEEVRDVCKRVSYPVQHVHDCQDMPAAWGHAKLAISAAGGSQFELGVCQTPALLIAIATNQLAAANHAQSQGWCELLHADVEKIAKRAIALYSDPDGLEKMHGKATGRYTSTGARKVLEKIARALDDRS